jgi:hypothetical protein
MCGKTVTGVPADLPGMGPPALSSNQTKEFPCPENAIQP